MGSGSTAVAAIRTGRHYLGTDTDETYVRAARARCDQEVADLAASAAAPARDPRKAKDVAVETLTRAGFRDIVVGKHALFTGVTIDIVATDAKGKRWYFDVAASFTSVRSSLHRADVVWRALGKAALTKGVPYVLLVTDRPTRASAAGRALLEGHQAGVLFDVLEVFATSTAERLRTYAAGGRTGKPPSRLFGE
jgi:hypothetical protein